MMILGIDPGFAIVGFGVIEAERDPLRRHHHSGGAAAARPAAPDIGRYGHSAPPV